MPDWQPRAGVHTATQRADLLARARDYFARQGVLAVDVPALGDTGVTDPNIACLRVAGHGWLQSSPEYLMKRLLAAGYPDIYSISRVFRDGESGRRHLREFTMIEWYRREFTLDEIIEDTARLVAFLLDEAPGELPVRVLDYSEAFLEACGLDPLTCPVGKLAECVRADEALRASLGDDREAWQDLVLATVIARGWPPGRITILKHYPASQAALARCCPSDDAVADRFELFAGDLELANGYVELRDADELAERTARDRRTRASRGLPDMAADDNLLAALEYGLPPCSGVALGFERLHMVAAGASDIREVVTFA